MPLSGMTRRRRAGVVILAAALGAAPADAASAPDAGIAFEPPALAAPRYAIQPPSADARQVRIVDAADGTKLYTDTWLPAPQDGNTPPSRLPVVVVYTI